MPSHFHLAALALLLAGAHAQLVAPGAVTEFDHTGGGRRSAGTGVVEGWAPGFYVGGSAIRELNGVYVAVDAHPDFGQRCQVSYANNNSPWYLALCALPDDAPERDRARAQTQWLLIDGTRPRFKHLGDTVIPGSGTRWSSVVPHAHGGDEAALAARSDAAALPWQLIYIGDHEMLHQIRYHANYYQTLIDRALSDDPFGLPHFAPERDRTDAASVPPREVAELVAEHIDLSNPVCDDAHQAAAMSRIKPRALKAGRYGWATAMVSVVDARCQRRAGNPEFALKAADAALRIYARYGDALAEKAKAMADMGVGSQALYWLKLVVRIDRDRPGLKALMVFCAADGERKARAATSNDTPPVSPYAVLGLPHDFVGEATLKAAYRSASKQAHPDRNSGSSAAFQAVSAAHAVLSDDARRAEYDAGRDMVVEPRNDGSAGRSFVETTEREYWPEKYEFEPFGDPLESKRAWDRENA